jgi:sirohydrochlorin cobaltochelatase
MTNSLKVKQVNSVKPVLLVVSYGTSDNESREKSIGAIEKAIAAAYPDHELRRAFTSQIIIDRVAKREGIRIDNVDEAIKRLVADDVKDVVVQPTYVINGGEYNEMRTAIAPYEKYFMSLRYGLPLLMSGADFAEVAGIIIAETKGYTAADTAVVFMGHGTAHGANAGYARLDKLLKDAGFPRYFVGSAKAAPSLDDIIAELDKLSGVTKVILLPFMIVAGAHAKNDMAGDEGDSWKVVLQARGYQVEPVLKGLGEYPGIRALFVRHAGEAL